MELDTGAAVSLVSEYTYRRLCPYRPLQETTTRLRTYFGEQLMVLGQLDVEVQYRVQRAHLPLCVIQGEGSSLLGRDWLRHLCLDWCDGLDFVCKQKCSSCLLFNTVLVQLLLY